MDFIVFILEHIINFGVASIPLIIVYLQLKIFKGAPKVATYLLTLNLLLSIFFWLKLKDISLVLYQVIPYVSSFIWVWCESLMKKRENNEMI